MNEQLIKQALKANNKSLGFNWIYDRKYLNQLSKKETLFGQDPKKEHFDNAKISFYGYKKEDIYTIQGHILYWLFEVVRKNSDFSELEYKMMLTTKLMPGGSYKGYVESYGKKLIYNELARTFNQELIVMDDDQLVSFIPYLVFKWKYTNDEVTDYMDKALKFTKVLSNNPNYKDYFLMLDYIIENTTYVDYEEDLKKAVEFAPKEKRESFKQAFIIKDAEEFITKYSGTSCNIDEAMSLIFYILVNNKGEDKNTLELNLKYGGASADRAIILTYLEHFIWINNQEPDG